MSWDADPIELVLGLVLALTGAVGMLSAYRRGSPSLEAQAMRSADLITFLAVTVLGLAASVQGASPWVHIAVLVVAITCFIAGAVVRRRASPPGAT